LAQDAPQPAKQNFRFQFVLQFKSRRRRNQRESRSEPWIPNTFRK
jgi:hypothetical protein